MAPLQRDRHRGFPPRRVTKCDKRRETARASRRAGRGGAGCRAGPHRPPPVRPWRPWHTAHHAHRRRGLGVWPPSPRGKRRGLWASPDESGRLSPASHMLPVGMSSRGPAGRGSGRWPRSAYHWPGNLVFDSPARGGKRRPLAGRPCACRSRSRDRCGPHPVRGWAAALVAQQSSRAMRRRRALCAAASPSASTACQRQPALPWPAHPPPYPWRPGP